MVKSKLWTFAMHAVFIVPCLLLKILAMYRIIIDSCSDLHNGIYEVVGAQNT